MCAASVAGYRQRRMRVTRGGGLAFMGASLMR